MITDDPFLYTPDLHVAELELAQFLVQKLKAGCDRLEPITDGLKFKQPEAVVNACTKPISVLTGLPGTGKTTTLRKIVESFSAAGLKGIVACPTGKAARRAREAVGAAGAGVEFSTVHMALKWSPHGGRFTLNRHNQLKHDFVIVDEFPMQDVPLKRSLMEAIPKQCRIVLSGDEHQLPSVGPGNVARDIIASNVFPVTVLTDILRQGKDSGIVYNASRILNGDPLTAIDPRTGEKFTDFYFESSADELQTAAKVVRYATGAIAKARNLDSIKDIQVLCPGKRAVIGTKHLGDEIGKLLNKAPRTRFGVAEGERVINGKNNYELGIINGDTGIVLGVDSKGGAVAVDFGPGAGADGTGRVTMSGESLEHLYPAWAFTVHKSQGSEFPVVVIPLHRCHATLLFRNLLYTGVTRARQLCCLIGDVRALDMAINTNRAIKRCTRLQSILTKLAAKTAA